MLQTSQPPNHNPTTTCIPIPCIGLIQIHLGQSIPHLILSNKSSCSTHKLNLRVSSGVKFFYTLSEFIFWIHSALHIVSLI